MKLVQTYLKDKNLKNLQFTKGSTFSLVIAYILLCAIFSILSPYFLTFKNIQNLGLYAAIIGIMAAGLTVPMLVGCLDLSQYATAALSGVLSTILVMNNNWPAGFVLVVVFLTGIIIGFMNGFIVAVLKINPMIATMATMLIIRSFCYITTKGATLLFQHKFLNSLGTGYTLLLPNSLWFMIFIFLILGYILKYTVFGRNVYAVGANAKASHLAGINIKKVQIISYIISGIAASFAGLLQTTQVGAAVPSSGSGSEMEVISAVILGGLSLAGGEGDLKGTLLGTLFIITVTNGLTLLSVQSYYQMLVRGLILLLAVYIDILRRSRKA